MGVILRASFSALSPVGVRARVDSGEVSWRAIELRRNGGPAVRHWQHEISGPALELEDFEPALIDAMCAPRASIKAAATAAQACEGKLLLLPWSLNRWLRFKLLVAGIGAFLLLSLVISPLLDLQHRYRSIREESSSSPSPPSAVARPRLSYDVLHYTALEPNDAEERDRIKQLLDSAGDRSSKYYYWHELASSSKPGKVDLDHGIDRRRIRRLRDRRWTPDLSNPRFAPYSSQFRQMLQSWARRKRYDPGIMKELLAAIKEPIDRHYGNGSTTNAAIEDEEEKIGGDHQSGTSPTPPRTRSYRTCAVVGNSGVLLNRSYGPVIDTHQMVMRLNNAKVVGYERCVGSKTTISFVNSNIVHACARRLRCACPGYVDNVPTISYICQIAHFLDVAYCQAFRRSPLLVTDPRFDSLSTRIIRYYSLRHFFRTTGKSYEEWNKLHDGALFHYSSGMQAVMLALGICDEKAELALHDYEAEYVLYDDLVHRPAMVPFLNESGVPVPPVRIFH